EAEERGEFDDRVHSDRGSVLEGIAYRVSHDCRRVEIRALLFEFNLHDLLRVVPRTAGVGHEKRLEEAEERNGDEVATKEIRLQAGEGEGAKENGEEDVDHPTLGIDGANLHHPLAVLDGGFFCAFQFDVGFDELHGPVGAGRNRLNGSSGEPEDHRASGDETQEERNMHERQRGHFPSLKTGQDNDNGENHGCRADHRGTNEDRLRGGLEGVAGAIVFLEVVLGFLELWYETEVSPDFFLDVGNRLDEREFVHRLRVVGDWAIGINGDGDRTHAKKAKSDEAKGEHWSGVEG